MNNLNICGTDINKEFIATFKFSDLENTLKGLNNLATLIILALLKTSAYLPVIKKSGKADKTIKKSKMFGIFLRYDFFPLHIKPIDIILNIDSKRNIIVVT